MNIKKIPIKDIIKDDNQPRKYFDEQALNCLIVSLKENNLESPITVRKHKDKYMIIDGERRWIAAQKAGLTELYCIITEKTDISEQQLRSDCLKEKLSPDELDEAIYKLYIYKIEHNIKGNKNSKIETNPYCQMIANEIGKTQLRISTAIDRCTWKIENDKEVEKIKKETKILQEDKGLDYLNATIAQTKPLNNLKNKEIRNEVIRLSIDEKIKNEKNKNKEKINDKIIEKVKQIKQIEKLNANPTIDDVKEIFKTGFSKKLLPDIQEIYDSSVLKISKAITEFKVKKFLDYPDKLDFSELIGLIENFLNQLKQSNKR